jgi:hypothetical protein
VLLKIRSYSGTSSSEQVFQSDRQLDRGNSLYSRNTCWIVMGWPFDSIFSPRASLTSRARRSISSGRFGQPNGLVTPAPAKASERPERTT